MINAGCGAGMCYGAAGLGSNVGTGGFALSMMIFSGVGAPDLGETNVGATPARSIFMKA
jgi:hypothetical protein